MVIMPIIFLLVLAAIYIMASGKYNEITGSLDKKLYPLAGALSIGLYLLDRFKYGFSTVYDRKILSAITEIYGSNRAVLLLKVHWGNKITSVLLSLLFAVFVGSRLKPDMGYWAFCILLPVGIAYFGDRDLFEKVKKRRKEIQLDFPDFVNKLTLLVNAGMTVAKAWERSAGESERQSPLYLEAAMVVRDIKAGVPERKAYEEFAKRCRVPVVSRFVSVILQNLRKGNAELVPILRMFAVECWELRKSTAKKLGEEASTKMLAPAMFMFVAILIIVGTPAVLALKNI